jgi:hypothetical protein
LGRIAQDTRRLTHDDFDRHTKNYGRNEAWEGLSSRPRAAEDVFPQTGKDMNPGRDCSESYVPVQLTNSDTAQEFVFPGQLTAWVKLTDLQETFPLNDNGVVETEVYGKDVEWVFFRNARKG